MTTSIIHRRDFLKAACTGAALLAAGCRPGLSEPAGWTESTVAPEDIRMRVLRIAILAPNPHNAQPWSVVFTGDSGMSLFVDQSRLLPLIDPAARQVHIGQGAFLELLEMAARQFGYRATVVYFPDREYSNSVLENRPVASISLYPDSRAEPDPLFAQISRRVSNKARFERNRVISQADAEALCSAPGTGSRAENDSSQTIGWWMTQRESELHALAAMCKGAMAVEASSPERNRETAEWFRFSAGELAEKRDGFGIEQSGVTGVREWIAETFLLNRQRAADPNGSFARGAVNLAGAQASTASAFAALIGTANTRLEQVLIGRAYCRVHLAAARLGLAMQPLSQLLEEYPEMDPLQRRLKQMLNISAEQTVQMLFRLGYAKPTPHTPRRDVRSLIRPGVAS